MRFCNSDVTGIRVYCNTLLYCNAYAYECVGVQWKKLFDRFELKDTRIVFTTAKVIDGHQQLVGKLVRSVNLYPTNITRGGRGGGSAWQVPGINIFLN